MIFIHVSHRCFHPLPSVTMPSAPWFAAIVVLHLLYPSVVSTFCGIVALASSLSSLLRLPGASIHCFHWLIPPSFASICCIHLSYLSDVR
jgi:hypothetical protein